MPVLSDAQLAQFIADGFVRIDNAFPASLADAARAVLWAHSGPDPDDSTTWTKPVVRLGHYSQQMFREAANTATLHAAYDQLVGVGRWAPCGSLGTFPIRFPSPDDPGDTGWHIDASFGWEEHASDFMSWRANVSSKGRALLMLFLFSDVSESDAPTRIRIGSHRSIARRLGPAGDAGLTLRELASTGFAESDDCPEALATGEAGTVYLCHPFLVHAAQPHRGVRPRFMAQPPLLPKVPLQLNRTDSAYSPVEQAIREALEWR